MLLVSKSLTKEKYLVFDILSFRNCLCGSPGCLSVGRSTRCVDYEGVWQGGKAAGVSKVTRSDGTVY
jgi:hypothetical protein